MIIVFHNTRNNDEMVGLNIRHLFMFDWGVYHNCLQEYVTFKQRHVFSFKYEINTLFSGEKGHFEGLELFERAEYIINMYTPKFKEI